MYYELIKEICDKKNLTICTVENRAGLGNGTIRKWKVYTPTVDKLQRVAKVLGVSISRLIPKE